MNLENYSHLSKKPQRKKQWLESRVTLKSFLHDQVEVNEQQLREAFINDLKNILEQDSAIEMIENIHEIEYQLEKICEAFPSAQLPNFEDFYKDFSRLLLQKYWEYDKNKARVSREDWFLATIQIALEEELYIWQEKSNN